MDEQHKRDEEAAARYANSFSVKVYKNYDDFPSFQQEIFDHFLAGLKHYRETVEIELECRRGLEGEVSKLEEQLRMAVEIIEIAKAFVHQEKGNICGRCDTEDHKYGWACRFSAALQKIEAMKGGGDE